MDYLDFEVEIGIGTGRTYPVAVVHSASGEARETMRFPFDELALENQLLALQNALLRSGGKRRQMLLPEEQSVQTFGRALFNALFTGEVGKRYAVSQLAAYTQKKGVRLKLRILAPELAALPWEFLYDPGAAEYLCLSSMTPIVRYLELAQPPQVLHVTPPLSILGVISSPKDLPELDVEREKQRLERAIQGLRADGLVELTWLPGQTWYHLQRAMRRGPWHILHFIGHGGFDARTDEGLIALEDEEGKAQLLTATHLGRLLADHRSLRLVVLNACEGAKGSEHDIFSSTATILVRRGIPAVLAMQYEITDRAAIELARAFYESVTDGLPVDTAVSEARKSISFGIANTLEWGTPVLYMRSPDGALFDVKSQPSASRDPTESLATITPPVVEHCPACKSELLQGGTFCPTCGHRLGQAAPTPQTPASSLRPISSEAQSAVHTYQPVQFPAPPWSITSPLTEEPSEGPDTVWGILTFENGPQFKLQAEQVVVGRYVHDLGGIPPDVDLGSMDGSDTISRFHARLEYIDGTSMLTDLKSTNSTRINNRRLEANRATPLHDGDTLSFGKVSCTFQAEKQVPSLPMEKSEGREVDAAANVQIEESSAASPVSLTMTKEFALIGTLTPDTDDVYTLTVICDGQTLVSCSFKMIKVWNLSSGKLLHTLTDHTDYVYSLAISPDGQTLVSGSRDKTIKVWNLSSGELLHTLTGHTGLVGSVAISPDGQTLVSGSLDMTIKVWNLPSGELLHTLTGHREVVYSLAISPDGQTLVSRSLDKTIKVWNLSSGKLLHTLNTLGVGSLAISPDGRTLISDGEDSTSKVWNLSSGKLLHTLTKQSLYVISVAISPDGQTLVTGSAENTIKIWNLPSGELLHTLTGHREVVFSAAISPDGQTLVSGSLDKAIKVWNLSSGKLLRTLTGHREVVESVAISPDGQTLVSGSGDKTIKVWNLSRGELLHTLTDHTNQVHSVAVSPDGQTLVSGSRDNTIKVWNLSSGKLLRTLIGHREVVKSVAISPDGQTLISGSADKTIKVWNLSSGELLHTLTDHTNSVHSVAISPDGQTLVSGSLDVTIKVWNLSSGKLLHILRDNTDRVGRVKISADGRTLVSLGYHAPIKVWSKK